MRSLAFAIAWALVIAGLAALLAHWRGEALSGRSAAVVAVFASGSFLGAWCAWGAASLVTLRRRKARGPARFAAMVLFLSVGTAAFAAFFFFLQLRAYYSEWHTQRISYRMLWEQVFTAATTAYIFGVMGVRALLPFALVPLLAFSLYFARIEPRRRVC